MREKHENSNFAFIIYAFHYLLAAAAEHCIDSIQLRYSRKDSTPKIEGKLSPVQFYFFLCCTFQSLSFCANNIYEP